MSNQPGRVCLVVQGFPPEPLPIPRAIALALVDRGWDVTVLTGIPNYPTGIVLDGYKATEFRRDLVDKLKVRRTALYPSHGRNPVKRFLNYGTWSVSAAVGGWREMRKADVVLVYSSPATAAFPAMVARLLTGRRYVLLIEDLWPDSIFASGFLTSGFAYRAAKAGLDWFCGLSYRLAEHVAVISPGMRDILAERGVPREKTSLVYNWVDEQVFTPASPDPELRRSLGLSDDDFVIMYGGNHGAAQKLDAFIRAMAQAPDGVHAVFVGDGVDKASLRTLADEVAPGRVHFLDPRPITDMPALIAAADVQLISLADQALFEITMPSKVQSSLAAGSPILLAAPGDAAAVITEAGAGFTARPEDVDDIARAIGEAAATPRDQLRTMGERARDYYLTHMAASVGSGRLSDILTSAFTRSRKATR